MAAVAVVVLQPLTAVVEIVTAVVLVTEALTAAVAAATVLFLLLLLSPSPITMIPRTSKIKPPRKSVTSVNFDQNWAVLSNAIVQIQNKNVSNLSYEHLYRKAYTLVLHKHGLKLYDSVSKLIQNHLLRRRQTILAQSTNLVALLGATLNEWNDHLQSMKFISDVLMYLNRVYVKEHNRLLIYDLGLQLFKDYVIMYDDNTVGHRLITGMVQEISRSRSGEVITTKTQITSVIGMFELLHESEGMELAENYYQKWFAPEFLRQSAVDFSAIVERLGPSTDPENYVVEADRFITDETNRVNFFLPGETVPKVVELMHGVFVRGVLEEVIGPILAGATTSTAVAPAADNADPTSTATTSTTTTTTAELTPGTTSANSTTTSPVALVYKLNHKIDPDISLLKHHLKSLIISRGRELPTAILSSLDAKKEKRSGPSSPPFALKYIDSVLNYKAQLSSLVHSAFDHNYSMEQCISGGIYDFVNGKTRAGTGSSTSSSSSGTSSSATGTSSSATGANATARASGLSPSPSELLSIYMDHHIKHALRPNSDFASVDNFVSRSLQFLRFIADKDAFEVYYKNHFAKRFLTAKGLNHGLGLDIEEVVIAKLSHELGTTALDAIIKMNQDIQQSRDLTQQWADMSGSNGSGSNTNTNTTDMELKVCNVTYWPGSMTKDYKKGGDGFLWPREIRATMRQFEQFWVHEKKNDNKSLYWSPKFGSMDLRISYPSRTYDITLSTYAAAVMLLFGPGSVDSDAFTDNRKLNYREIKELSGIPDLELRRHLQSIAVAPRLRLLTKIPMTKDVNDDDIFQLNHKFKSPSSKVKVLTVSSTKKAEDVQEIDANITEGRKHEVNAAVVRIMKSRRSIGHTDLVAEIIKQLSSRFVPATVLIKRQVEELIEKEYMKRDEEDRGVYHYVA